jgi:predicted phage replisome organizer
MANYKKKYYWLKLDRNFFKRHDIRVIEAMDNGKDYILFYLKLLVESIDHEGELRFSETIPYDDKMLSVITNTNIDIVRTAIKIFSKLSLMEIYDDKTIYLNETEKMLGKSASTHRVQAYREREKQKQLNDSNVTETLHETQLEKEKELEEEEDIEKENKSTKTKRFVKPTIDELEKYIKEKKYNIDAERFFHYYESKGWKVGNANMKSWKSAMVTWNKNRANGKNSYNKKEKDDVSIDWLDEYK